MDKEKDYYAILGVHPKAEDAIIRAAYKILAQKYHPDKAADQSVAFQARMSLINEAYSTLKDPQKRRQYDNARLSDVSPNANTEDHSRKSPRGKRDDRQYQIDNLDGLSKDCIVALQAATAKRAGLASYFKDGDFSCQVRPKYFGFGSTNLVISSPDLAVIPPGMLRNHIVVRQPFTIGRYVVTNADYVAFCRATDRRVPDDARKTNHPARGMTWHDAVGYCEWLSEITNKEYRLPTREEWEFACRSGTTTKYWFGDEIHPSQANFGGYYWVFKSDKSGKHPKPKHPLRQYSGRDAEAPVDKYQENTWGLFQMHGNVKEWVSDVAVGDIRYVCGGGWTSYEDELASSHYEKRGPRDGYVDIGFRVARNL